MARSTTRKKQVANTTQNTSGRKNALNAMPGSATETKQEAGGIPLKGHGHSPSELLAGIVGTSLSATATEAYTKRQAIDSMCRMIEKEQGRSMEDKMKAYDHVLEREKEINDDAHKKTLEEKIVVLDVAGLIIAGLCWLNKKGIIKLPVISIF